MGLADRLGIRFVRVKENSRRMYDLCMRRAASIGRADYIRTEGRMDLTHTFRTDMLHFLIYLGYADGRISREEVQYINQLIGTQFDERMIREYADAWGLRTESIRERAPLSLDPFVRSNVGAETGEISDRYYDLVQLYVTTFNYIGNDMLACNNEISDAEVQALSSYIEMLTAEVSQVREDIAAYKPTIAFKPGSQVKQEEKPNYSYWAEPVKEQRAKIVMPQRETEESAAACGSGTQNPKRPMAEHGSGTQNPKSAAADRMDETQMRTPGAKSEDRVWNIAEHVQNREDRTPDRSDGWQVQNASKTDQKENKESAAVQSELDVQALLQKLNDLTGMQSVKTEIRNMINLLKICRIRQENGLQTPPVTNHLVFLGNPGTGKTTVARILAQIYHGLGVLSKGHLVEVDRSGLVAGYMGQTSEKVTEVIEKAKGGILFIDEAYALANGQDGDFGQEAIDILNKAMEDNREDLVVIAAGYHDEMQDFLDANPGLRSRFNRTIEFPDYTADELMEILNNRAKALDYTLTADAAACVRENFEQVLQDPPENFGNARSARNFLDRVIHNQANRLVSESNFREEDLMRLTAADVEGETLA